MKICNRIIYLLFTLMYISFHTGLGAQQRRCLAEVSAFVGNDVIIPCQETKNANITQGQWTLQQSEQEKVLIVFNSKGGENIPNSSLCQRVKLEGQSLTIQAVKMTDAGCYICSIFAYPSGKIDTTTKLVVKEHYQELRLPTVIACGVFLMIVGTMIAGTYFIIRRIRRKVVFDHRVYTDTVETVMLD